MVDECAQAGEFRGHEGLRRVCHVDLPELWKQRNARVFSRAEQQVDAHELMKKILEELSDWKTAVRGGGSLQRFVRD